MLRFRLRAFTKEGSPVSRILMSWPIICSKLQTSKNKPLQLSLKLSGNMNKPAVDIQDLGFSYSNPPHTCFSGLDLKINSGERFGLFGPNGAGKTTLMSCMTGLLSFQK